MASEPHTLQPRVSTRYRFRWHSAAFLATMFVLAIMALAAVIASSRASSTPLLDERTMAATRELAAARQPARISLAGASEIQLMLPVYEQQVTAIGYHPVEGDNLIPLNPNGRQLNGSFISNLGLMTADNGPGYFLMSEGGRFGSPTCSIDIGAPAGTVIFAPVDGTVAGIRSYNLKGECPDMEVKIQPQFQTNMLVVMTHMDSIQATLGQPVRAGETRLGSVRQLDGCIEQQLSRYTYDSGNHVHMQAEYLNKQSRL